MKRFMLAMLLVGAALLGFILYRADLPEVAAHLLRMGGGGLVAVLALYLAGSVSVCASWLWTLPERLFTGRWLFRLWRAWMVGSAFETLFRPSTLPRWVSTVSSLSVPVV